MESDLTTLLKTVTAQVFPDFAPAGIAAPWITYQHIGGQSVRFAEGTPADKRHTAMQVNVWAATRLQALALMRQVEATICNLAAATFTAQPASEPIGTFEQDLATPLYGCIQDFDIWSTR